MYRREFIGLLGSTAAGAALQACAARSVRRLSTTGGGRWPLDPDAFHSARRFADTSFGKIAYIDRGTGAAALFLHGFPLNSFQWRGAIGRLAPRRRCIAPDFLGLGYTEIRDGQSVAPDAQLSMVTTLLDSLSIDRVDVIANDSGGAIAQLLAARHPERVRTLLLTNCDTEIDSPPAAMLPVIEMSKAGTYVDKWLVPWLEDKALARSAEGIGGMCYADPAYPTDEAIECYFGPLVRSARRKAQVEAYAVALGRNPLEGVEAALRRCRAPMRIVWGTGDTIFSGKSPDYLDRTSGNSRGVRRLAGRKLFWPEELPSVIGDEALRLWASSAG